MYVWMSVNKNFVSAINFLKLLKTRGYCKFSENLVRILVKIRIQSLLISTHLIHAFCSINYN